MAGRPSKPLAHYPNRIREVREAKGLTLKALAAKIGTSAAQLQRYETGDRGLSVHHLEVIAKALSVTACELLNGFKPVENQQEAALRDIFHRLPARDRERLVRMAAAFLPSDQDERRRSAS